MSWTDKKSLEVINKIRDYFQVDEFIETGTFKGINAKLQSKNFKRVFTCEKEEKYFDIAYDKLKDCNNIGLYLQDSSKFLKKFTPNGKNRIFYLDAHFYDKNLKQKFVVIDELRALKGFGDCIIIIHDFDNGLGHINYDGQPLNLRLIYKYLMEVNKNFKIYTNELSGCDIKKLEEANDWDEFENLKYAWSKPEKTYRGILYVVPKRLPDDFGLKEITWNLI